MFNVGVSAASSVILAALGVKSLPGTRGLNGADWGLGGSYSGSKSTNNTLNYRSESGVYGLLRTALYLEAVTESDYTDEHISKIFSLSGLIQYLPT